MMANSKFKLTDETKEVDGVTLHRIQALRDIDVSSRNIEAGMLGGFVERESNLESGIDSVAWIDEDGVVMGDSEVTGSAFIDEGSVIKDSTVEDSYVIHSSLAGSNSLGDSIGSSNLVDSETAYTQLSSSKINDSEISGGFAFDAEVTGSELQDVEVEDSKIVGSKVFDTEMEKAQVNKSTVAKGLVMDSEVHDSRLDETWVAEGSKVQNSRIARTHYKASYVQDAVREDRKLVDVDNVVRIGDEATQLDANNTQNMREYNQSNIQGLVDEHKKSNDVSLSDDDLADLNEPAKGLEQ